MVMSQPLMSASLIGLPSPGFSAHAAPAPSAAASRTPATSGLRIDMLDLPLGIDAPAGEAVVVLVGKRQGVTDRRFGLATGGNEIGPQRLRVSGFVPRP